jgi:predicted nucleic acid-binding protein
MILLDTNVISELMKQLPMPAVLTWINQQQSTELVISTITIAEITYGLQVLPRGKRRTGLELAFEQAINEAFHNHILPFDESAAYFYGKIMGHRKQLGQPMSLLDGQIAAIALSQNASVATRNTNDFQSCGLTLINPFD